MLTAAMLFCGFGQNIYLIIFRIVHSYDIDPININLANDMLKESFEDRIGMFELINIDLKT